MLIGKVLINMLLVVEVGLKFNYLNLSTNEEALSNLTTFLIYSLAGLFVLQYFVTTFSGFWKETVKGIKSLFPPQKRPKKILKMRKREGKEVLSRHGRLNKGEHLHPKSQFNPNILTIREKMANNEPVFKETDID